MPQSRKKSKRSLNRKSSYNLPENGTYALLLMLQRSATIKVGSFNKIFFKKGGYVYVGSARRGLRARVGRHLAKKKKIHWHIDWVTTNRSAKVYKIWVSSVVGAECRLAAAIAEEADEVVRGFGSSDCKCQSHLFYFTSRGRAELVLSKLGLSSYKSWP